MASGPGPLPASSASIWQELSKDGAAVESLPAIDWLLSHDILADANHAAALALRRIRDPAADEILLSILSAPHPQGAVLTIVLEEVATRNLAGAAPPVTCGLGLRFFWRRYSSSLDLPIAFGWKRSAGTIISRSNRTGGRRSCCRTRFGPRPNCSLARACYTGCAVNSVIEKPPSYSSRPVDESFAADDNCELSLGSIADQTQ